MPRTRSQFGSAIGFILSGVGAAVGLGSFWRFPQLTSQNGGGAFVLLFIVALLIFGVPLLWGELAIGQRMQLSSVRAFEAVADRRWRLVGYLFITGTFILLSYYTILAGYVLRYMVSSFGSAIADDPAGFLAESVAGPGALFFGILIALMTGCIVAIGVAKGLEKANLVMMPALFLFLLVLVVYAQFQPGAAAGRNFYLTVDWSEINANTIRAAVAQVFFAVGIGFGIMLTYASYTPIGRPLLVSSIMINGSILVVGFLAGLMVFPLAFSHGLQDAVRDPAAGAADTLFLTMPTTFVLIGGFLGAVLMFVFFLMLLFAAVSSTISALEVLVSHVRDEFGWGRTSSNWIASEFYLGPAVLAAMSPAVFSWLNTVLDLFLFLAVIGLCLVYTFVIKDRADFLLGKTKDPAPWVRRAANISVVILAYVAPVVLIAIFILALPGTLAALLP
jgi:neurotransmitter:Na+ symporter, NSS family